MVSEIIFMDYLDPKWVDRIYRQKLPADPSTAPYRAQVQLWRTHRATRPPAPTRLAIAPPFCASPARDALSSCARHRQSAYWAGRDRKRKDLSLAQRQPFVASAPLPLLSPRLPLGGTLRQCPLHRFYRLIPRTDLVRNQSHLASLRAPRRKCRHGP